jgi:hypothetical protein
MVGPMHVLGRYPRKGLVAYRHRPGTGPGIRRGLSKDPGAVDVLDEGWVHLDVDDITPNHVHCPGNRPRASKSGHRHLKGVCLRSRCDGLVSRDDVPNSVRDTTMHRATTVGRCRRGQSGGLPCLRRGSSSRLERSTASALTITARVRRGSITSSMRPRSAAT